MSFRKFVTLGLVAALLSAGSRAHADGGSPVTLGDFIPELKGPAPLPGAGAESDAYLHQVRDCVRLRSVGDTETLPLRPEGVVCQEVAGTELEPFMRDVYFAVQEKAVSAYFDMLRILALSRLFSSHRYFVGRDPRIPDSCHGKVDDGFKTFHALPAHVPTADEDRQLMSELRRAAHRVLALMAEQEIAQKAVDQARAGGANFRETCDFFIRGSQAHPLCSEEELTQVTKMIESYYSAYPYLAAERDPLKPHHEEWARIMDFVTLSDEALSARIQQAREALSRRTVDAMEALCSDDPARGVSWRDLSRLSALTGDSLWDKEFPELGVVRSCAHTALGEQASDDSRTQTKMGVACFLLGIPTGQLAPAACKWFKAIDDLDESSRQAIWLGKCRAAGDAVCTGSEIENARLAHNAASAAKTEAITDAAMAIATTVATGGFLKLAAVPRIPVAPIAPEAAIVEQSTMKVAVGETQAGTAPVEAFPADPIPDETLVSAENARGVKPKPKGEKVSKEMLRGGPKGRSARDSEGTLYAGPRGAPDAPTTLRPPIPLAEPFEPEQFLEGLPMVARRISQVLIRGRRVQQAIWELREAGYDAAADGIEAQLKNKLATDKIVKRVKLDGGKTESYLVTYEDGTQAVFKPGNQAHPAANHLNEIAEHVVDRYFKLDRVPVTVEGSYNGRMGSFQYFVRGARTAKELNADAAKAAVAAGKEAPALIRPDWKIRFLDFLTGNTDRNTGNYMMIEGARPRQVAVDHGLAFEAENPRVISKMNDALKGADQVRELLPTLEIYERLQSMTPEVIRSELGPYLNDENLNIVIEQRRILLDKVKRFDVYPAGGQLRELPHDLGVFSLELLRASVSV